MMLSNYVRLKGKQCLIGKSHRIDDEIQLFINIVFDAIRLKIEFGIKSHCKLCWWFVDLKISKYFKNS